MCKKKNLQTKFSMSFDKVFHAFKEGCNAASGIPHYVTSPPKKLYLERFFLDQHDHVAKFLRTHKEMGWIYTKRSQWKSRKLGIFVFAFTWSMSIGICFFSRSHVFHWKIQLLKWNCARTIFCCLNFFLLLMKQCLSLQQFALGDYLKGGGVIV